MGEDSSNKKNPYELLREKNIKEKDALLKAKITVEAVSEAINNIQEFSQSTRKRTAKRRRPIDEPSCTPTEVRRSCRLAHIPAPQYDDETLETMDSKANARRRVKTAVKSPRKRATTTNSKAPLSVIIPVEEVTEKMLSKIATCCKDKILDKVHGVVCHQCRQKTLDTKTVCRSGICRSTHGHFCGPCLKNRYGEEVAWALKNPNWTCPYCREICNCSFCRAKVGKAPTGPLIHIALQLGYKCVRDYLLVIENPNRTEKDEEGGVTESEEEVPDEVTERDENSNHVTNEAEGKKRSGENLDYDADGKTDAKKPKGGHKFDVED